MRIYIPFIIVILFIIIQVIRSIKVIKNGEIGVVERFGKVITTKQPGITFVSPLSLSRIRIMSINEQVIPASETAYSSDKILITYKIETIYKVSDPLKAMFSTKQLNHTVKYISATLFKKIIVSNTYDNLKSNHDFLISEFMRDLGNCLSEMSCELISFKVKEITRKGQYAESLDQFKSVNTSKSSKNSGYEPTDDNPIKF
jgi:regulator of protease activity HflC (stomatin/prohibitin superfamily)